MQDLAYSKGPMINMSKEVNEIVFNKFKESMTIMNQPREVLNKDM